MAHAHGRPRPQLLARLGSSAASNLADGIFWIAFPLLAIQLTDCARADRRRGGRRPPAVARVRARSRARSRTGSTGAARCSRSPRSAPIVARSSAVGDRHRRRSGCAILYVDGVRCWASARRCSTPPRSRSCRAIVERDQLSDANGRLYAAELTMNQFVGPPLGGILARRRHRRSPSPARPLAFAFAASWRCASHRHVPAARAPEAATRASSPTSARACDYLFAPSAAADARADGRRDEPRLVGRVRGLRAVRGGRPGRWASTTFGFGVLTTRDGHRQPRRIVRHANGSSAARPREAPARRGRRSRGDHADARA